MVIPDMRLSPVCSARANALRGQQRTADLIPDWLRVSTQLTFHLAGAIVKAPRGSNCQVLWIGPLSAATTNVDRRSAVLGVGGQMLSPSESEAWRR